MSASESQTKHTVGVWGLVFLGIGGAIGAGIISIFGRAIAFSGQSAWIAYGIAIVLGFVAIMPTMILTSAVRVKGGIYTILAGNINNNVAGAVGMSLILMMMWMGIFAIALGEYVQIIVPGASTKVVGIVALTVLAAINIAGIHMAKTVQGVLTSILIIGLLIIGFYGVTQLRPDAFNVTQEGYFLGGSKGIFQSVMLLFATTSGYTAISAYSGYCKDPKKVLPRAFLIIPVVLAVVYLTVGLTQSNILPIEEVAGKPLSVVVKVLFSDAFFYFFIVAGPIMALLTTMNAFYSVFERPLLQVARDGFLPRVLTDTNKHGVAWKIILGMYIASVLTVVSDLNMVQLLSNVTLIVSLKEILIVYAITRFPKKMEGAWENRSFRIPMSLFVIVCVAAGVIRLILFVVALETVDTRVMIISLSVFAAMFAWAFLRIRSGKAKVEVSWSLQ